METTRPIRKGKEYDKREKEKKFGREKHEGDQNKVSFNNSGAGVWVLI